MVADLWSAPPFVFWRSPNGAVGNVFLNVCHHVRTIANLFWTSYHHVRSLVCVWVNWMTGFKDGESHFRMRMIVGTILIWFLVLHVSVPECSRNGSGVRPYLWVQMKLVKFRQMRDSVLLNSWESFLVTLPSIFSEHCVICVIYSSLILGTDVFCDWPFLGCSSCASLVTAANFRLFLNVAIFWRLN